MRVDDVKMRKSIGLDNVSDCRCDRTSRAGHFGRRWFKAHQKAVDIVQSTMVPRQYKHPPKRLYGTAPGRQDVAWPPPHHVGWKVSMCTHSSVNAQLF